MANRLTKLYDQYGVAAPDRIAAYDDSAITDQDVQNLQKHLEELYQTKDASGTSTGGTTQTATPTATPSDQVTADTIQQLFDRYGVDPNTSVEDAQTRIERILGEVQSGSRSLSSVEDAIKGISTGAITFDPNASPEFGGAGTSSSSTTSGSSATDASTVTTDQIRSLFQKYNVPIENDNETESQRLQRIMAEVQSGQRTMADVEDAISKIASGVYSNAGHLPGAGTQALPQGARLVKVGNEYRVVWALGEGKGWAWYSIDSNRLNQLYGTSTPSVYDTVANASSFDAKYNAGYWGDISEVSQTANSPWQDMTNRIYNAFGFVPGMDNPEIQDLLTQAWFENWSAEEFIANYKGSNYYNSLADAQRAWVGLSEAEKQTRIQQTRQDMIAAYRQLWGADPPASVLNSAEAIASGQMVMDEWVTQQRKAAENSQGTPAALDALDLLRKGRQPEIDQENLANYVEQQWRAWIGPSALPADFAARWGHDLYMNLKSQADLESTLKAISQSQWPDKPTDLTYSDWSAPRKGQISSLLELGTVDDNDPLLQSLLLQGLSGQDAISLIRSDPRFRNTQQMYSQLSKAASELGRLFGFIG